MDHSKVSARQSEIQLKIFLDQNNVPENILWEASDADEEKHEAKALLLGLWDKNQGNGVSIDLWTKEMTVPEMNIFFYQTFLSMSDTIHRATQDKTISDFIRNFASTFLEKINSTP